VYFASGINDEEFFFIFNTDTFSMFLKHCFKPMANESFNRGDKRVEFVDSLKVLFNALILAPRSDLGALSRAAFSSELIELSAIAVLMLGGNTFFRT